MIGASQVPNPIARCDAPGRVALAPRLQIREVEEAHRALVDSLNREGALQIDVSPLEAVDTAGVQLLLALQREGERRGLPVEFCGVSTALERALALLGLELRRSSS